MGGNLIYLTQRVVNVMQSGCRVVSQKREDFETITGFSASIGSCPSLGADNPRLSLLGACPEKAVIDIWEVLIVVNKATSVYWAMDAPIWQR